QSPGAVSRISTDLHESKSPDSSTRRAPASRQATVYCPGPSARTENAEDAAADTEAVSSGACRRGANTETDSDAKFDAGTANPSGAGCRPTVPTSIDRDARGAVAVSRPQTDRREESTARRAPTTASSRSCRTRHDALVSRSDHSRGRDGPPLSYSVKV